MSDAAAGEVGSGEAREVDSPTRQFATPWESSVDDELVEKITFYGYWGFRIIIYATLFYFWWDYLVTGSYQERIYNFLQFIFPFLLLIEIFFKTPIFNPFSMINNMKGWSQQTFFNAMYKSLFIMGLVLTFLTIMFIYMIIIDIIFQKISSISGNNIIYIISIFITSLFFFFIWWIIRQSTQMKYCKIFDLPYHRSVSLISGFNMKMSDGGHWEEYGEFKYILLTNMFSITVEKDEDENSEITVSTPNKQPKHNRYLREAVSAILEGRPWPPEAGDGDVPGDMRPEKGA